MIIIYMYLPYTNKHSNDKDDQRYGENKGDDYLHYNKQTIIFSIFSLHLSISKCYSCRFQFFKNT